MPAPDAAYTGVVAQVRLFSSVCYILTKPLTPRTPPITHPHRCKHAEIRQIHVKDIEDMRAKTDRPHTDKLPPTKAERAKRASKRRARAKRASKRARARYRHQHRERALQESSRAEPLREHHKRALEERGSIRDTRTNTAREPLAYRL